MPEAMNRSSITSFVPAAAPGERFGGGEELFKVLPEVVVPVEEREGRLAGMAGLVLDLAVGEEEEQSFHRLAVEGQAAGGELVLHGPVLPVRGERAVFRRERLLQLVEAGLHFIRAGRGVAVVDGDLEEPAGVEAAFDRLGGGAREIAGLGRNAEDPKRGLLSGQGNVNVQGMSGSPVDQLLRSVAPAQAERRVQQGLCMEGRGPEPETEEACCEAPDQVKEHARRVVFFRRSRKPGRRNGSVLVEATLAMAMLTTIGLILLKLSLNVTVPRQWTLQQAITDSYLTFEKASAQRQSFEAVTGGSSLWPQYPSVATTTVTFGKLPGGTAITGTVTRTRIPDSNNLPAKGGSGTAATNPSSMEVWRLQSVVRYTVGKRSYMKSRTVVRSQ